MSDAQTSQEVPAHHPTRRALHWIVAALVIATLPLGVVFTDFDNKPWTEATFGAGSFDALFDLHKSIGLLVLALMLARLWAWRRWASPPYATPLPPQAEKAARLSHAAFYALLIGAALLGWAGVSAYPAPLPVFGLFEAPKIVAPDRALSGRLLGAHALFTFVLAGLVAVHVGAALWHRYARRDGVFERMAPGARRGASQD